MEWYLQEQDLWKVVDGSDATLPNEVLALKKWRIKMGKTMFFLKITIEKELLEHICHKNIPN